MNQRQELYNEATHVVLQAQYLNGKVEIGKKQREEAIRMEQERVQSFKEKINKIIFESLTNLQKDAVETLRKTQPYLKCDIH